jgi:hypothetical protein
VLSFKEGSVDALNGHAFFDSVPLSDLTFTACDPYTAALGIPATRIPLTRQSSPCVIRPHVGSGVVLLELIMAGRQHFANAISYNFLLWPPLEIKQE